MLLAECTQLVYLEEYRYIYTLTIYLYILNQAFLCFDTVWHKKLAVTKFYSLSTCYSDQNLTDFNFTEAP